VTTALALRAEVGLQAACAALGASRATVYRRLRPRAVQAPQRPSRTLSEAERAAVVEVLHSERFRDQAPAEVYGALLDEGAYLCSVRTMYRILDTAQETGERRAVRRHASAPRPELVARGPNQVWTWDITVLKGPVKGERYALYVVIDLYSRYVVGWTLARTESAALAERLLAETLDKHEIAPDSLTLHADRGAPMRSKTVAQLLGDLGVTASFSRPRVSNDNAFSESQFKTLKYNFAFPGRFGSFEDALRFLRAFFSWYNQEHHHSSLGLLTPHQVHSGQTEAVLGARQKILEAAYAAHPERFVHGLPRPQKPAAEVWINPPDRSLDLHDSQTI
jgi:putative transposase